MEAATIEQTEIPQAAAQVSAQKMFRYSTFVDIGEGAETCEHARDGKCDDIEHFHAWCRLPNPYQHEDIRKKAMAAKARKLRELRDPESDASVVLDEQLTRMSDEVYREQVIDDLLLSEWANDYLQAQGEVDEREEYEHVAQDREEYVRLHEAEKDLPEEEQTDEYKRLVTHLDAWASDVRERLTAIQEPKRQQFRDRSIDALVELIRSKRVEEESNRAFSETYDPWMWFVGTFKVVLHETLRRPHIPMWEQIGRKDRPDAGTMYGEAPEVIDELKRVFNDLQIALQKGSAGN